MIAALGSFEQTHTLHHTHYQVNSLELAEAGLSLGEYGVADTRAVIVFFANAESASHHGERDVLTSNSG